MGIGWEDVQRVKNVETMANELGFMFATGRFSYTAVEGPGLICLKPKDDCLPHYSRDAEIKFGTIEQLELWLRGIKWAREYDEILKVSNTAKREQAEQRERNRQLMETIKQGKQVEGSAV